MPLPQREQQGAADPPTSDRSAEADDSELLDEQALIEACRRGDRSALARVLGQHIRVLERVVLRMVWDKADAEDVLQQTLTTAVESFSRFRGESAIQTWLIGIAVGISRNHSRMQKRRRVYHEPAPLPNALLASEASAEQQAHDRALLERLQRHLSLLSPKRREVWVLHVLEGRTIEEIAQIVGANQFTTKSRLFMARKELRRRLRHDPALSPMLRGGNS
jgi:RNA polymerase sigma-70 factor (ECF subfamily)